MEVTSVVIKEDLELFVAAAQRALGVPESPEFRTFRDRVLSVLHALQISVIHEDSFVGGEAPTINSSLRGFFGDVPNDYFMLDPSIVEEYGWTSGHARILGESTLELTLYTAKKARIILRLSSYRGRNNYPLGTMAVYFVACG